MTPFVHVAAGADFASPFANVPATRLGYIDGDVTLFLHRLPVTRWVGFEVVNHHLRRRRDRRMLTMTSRAQ